MSNIPEAETTHSFSSGAGVARDKVSAASLDQQFSVIVEYINTQLVAVLNNIARSDGTLADTVVRVRNLHPEILSAFVTQLLIATIESGEGVPSSSVGKDGDFYFDTSVPAFYGPKADGEWPAGMSLVGPQGDQGEAGESFDWQSGWVTATDYTVNQGVSLNGASYVCIADHTSGSTTQPGVGASWATVWDLLAQRGADGAGIAVPGDVTVSADATSVSDTLDTTLVTASSRSYRSLQAEITFTKGSDRYVAIARLTNDGSASTDSVTARCSVTWDVVPLPDITVDGKIVGTGISQTFEIFAISDSSGWDATTVVQHWSDL